MIHGTQDPHLGGSVGQTLVRHRESRASKRGEREAKECRELLHASPERVRVHDFVIQAPTGGKAILYGVYDLHRNEGWVSVGIDHDTATFAVQSIQRWWQHMGRPVYREAQSLLITADAGGSNGARLRL